MRQYCKASDHWKYVVLTCILVISPLIGFTEIKGTSVFSYELRRDVVMRIVIDPKTPSTIYAGTNLGICKSTDGGKSWSDRSKGIGDPEIHALAANHTNPSILYAASDFLYASKDGGKHWTRVDTGLTNEISVLNWRRSCPETLYAGTYNKLLMYQVSENRWDRVPMSGIVYAIAMDQGNPAVMYAGTNRGIFRSADRGLNWVPSGLELQTIQSIAIDPFCSNNVFAVTNGSGIFRSTNSGLTWDETNSGLTGECVTCITMNPGQSGLLYVGTQVKGVFISRDGGEHWHSCNGELSFLTVNAISIVPDNPHIIYAGTSSGIFKSEDGGATWIELGGFKKFAKRK